MTQIGLILAIHVGALIFAALLVYWLLAREPGSAELKRLSGAIERAVSLFMRAEYRLVTVATFGVSAALVLLHIGFGTAQASIGFRTGLWMALGTFAGAISSVLVATAAAQLALRASVRATAATTTSLDRALSVALRSSAAASVLAEVVGLLGAGGLFALIYAMGGGLGAEASAEQLGYRAGLLCTSYGVGAALAALIFQRTGATYHSSADAGGDTAAELDAGLEHDDPRNPAVISDLVGDHVGLAASRVVDLFASSTLANVVLLVVSARVLSEHSSEMLGLAALPFTVRAFGLLACSFGVMVARTRDGDDPVHALWRGQLSTALITLGGIAGATMWLTDERWYLFFAAGALGVVASGIAAQAARWRIERRRAPMRELLDSLRAGHAITITHGLGIGMQSALLPVVTIGAALASAWQLGEASGISAGGLFGTLTGLTALLASAPYFATLGCLGAIADNARGVLAVSRGQVPDEARRRAGKLDDAGFTSAAVAQSYLILASCTTATIAAVALGTSAAVDLSKPAVAWSGALGAVCVFAYAGASMRSAARGARAVSQEVERQLHGFPRTAGIAVIPQDFTPSYRSCVDVATHNATRGALASAGAALAVPVLLGAALALMYRTSHPTLPSEALTCFVLVAAVTGLGAALALDGARTVLGAVRRSQRPRGATSGHGASVGGDTAADIFGNAAGSAAHLMVKAVAIAAFAIVPFLT